LALHPDGQRAVVLGPRPGDEPVGQLLLDGDRHGSRRPVGGQQVGENRGGHAVGEIGHELELPIGVGGQLVVDRLHHGGIESVLVLQHVAPEHGDVVHPVQLLAGQLEQIPVELDGDHGGGPGGHQHGQRAGACADFQHDVAGSQVGAVEQELLEIQVDEEVLPQLGAEMDSRLGETPPQERQGLVVGGAA